MIVGSTIVRRRRPKSMTRKSKGQERRSRGRNPGTSQLLLASWKGFCFRSSNRQIPPLSLKKLRSLDLFLVHTDLAMSRKEFWGWEIRLRTARLNVQFCVNIGLKCQSTKIFVGTNQANWRGFPEIDEIRRADRDHRLQAYIPLAERAFQGTTKPRENTERGNKEMKSPSLPDCLVRTTEIS